MQKLGEIQAELVTCALSAQALRVHERKSSLVLLLRGREGGWCGKQALFLSHQQWPVPVLWGCSVSPAMSAPTYYHDTWEAIFEAHLSSWKVGCGLFKLEKNKVTVSPKMVTWSLRLVKQRSCDNRVPMCSDWDPHGTFSALYVSISWELVTGCPFLQDPEAGTPMPDMTVSLFIFLSVLIWPVNYLVT